MIFILHVFLISVNTLVFAGTVNDSTDSTTRPMAKPTQRVSPTEVASFDIQKSTQIDINRSGRNFSISTHGKIGKYCIGPKQYFTKDGRLGLKGRLLEQELTGHGRSTPMKHLFFRNTFPGMENICPKFNKFTDQQKLNFWIWYFTAMAATESECGRNEYNPNDPQGTSAGELQLPERLSSRKWRGVQSGAGGCDARPPKVRPSSYRYKHPPALYMGQLENNLSCGVEILAGVLCGFYKNPIERCNSSTNKPYGNGFWKQIRTGINGKIIKDVKRLPICK